MAFLEKIARAFPPITEQEKYWLERIKIAIEKV
jgi:hypothetical protein